MHQVKLNVLVNVITVNSFSIKHKTTALDRSNGQPTLFDTPRRFICAMFFINQCSAALPVVIVDGARCGLHLAIFYQVRYGHHRTTTLS